MADKLIIDLSILDYDDIVPADVWFEAYDENGVTDAEKSPRVSYADMQYRDPVFTSLQVVDDYDTPTLGVEVDTSGDYPVITAFGGDYFEMVMPENSYFNWGGNYELFFGAYSEPGLRIAELGVGNAGGFNAFSVSASSQYSGSDPINGTQHLRLVPGGTAQEGVYTVVGNYTASTTQTQAAATQLIGSLNRVGVCANSGDSAKMPYHYSMTRCRIVNAGVQPLRLFPFTGGQFTGAALNAAYGSLIASGAWVEFVNFNEASPLWRLMDSGTIT